MRDPDEFHPEYISDDEAARRYEDSPEFGRDAIAAAADLLATPGSEVPGVALLAWYRTTSAYEDAVRRVRDDAERPWV